MTHHMGLILGLGEILVDMLPEGHERGSPLASAYVPRLGGAPANVAISLARLGAPVALVCGVGGDPPGAHVLDALMGST